MATKDELYTFAMALLDNAKNALARDGSVMNTHTLLKRNAQKVCIAEAGVDKDAMARMLKAVAPACKAVGSTFEAWMARDVDARPSLHPSRFEAIVVLVQSKEGSWFITAKFDRDAHGKPRPPSAPEMSWNGDLGGRYTNLYA